MKRRAEFGAVLFDLDGTLVDTARDMVSVLMQQLRDEGRRPIEYALARSNVSNGSSGLINVAFPDVSDSEHERLRSDYLDRYEESVCVESALFPGMADLLDTLQEATIPWGIVTNKPSRMTEPLLDALQLKSRAACAISGDTIPQRKPSPAPMLLASAQIGVSPDMTVYIGDALRDIDAGKAAGMRTIAAGYGYIPADDDPYAWGADVVIDDPLALAKIVLKGVSLT